MCVCVFWPMFANGQLSKKSIVWLGLGLVCTGLRKINFLLFKIFLVFLQLFFIFSSPMMMMLFSGLKIKKNDHWFWSWPHRSRSCLFGFVQCLLDWLVRVSIGLCVCVCVSVDTITINLTCYFIVPSLLFVCMCVCLAPINWFFHLFVSMGFCAIEEYCCWREWVSEWVEWSEWIEMIQFSIPNIPMPLMKYTRIYAAIMDDQPFLLV